MDTITLKQEDQHVSLGNFLSEAGSKQPFESVTINCQDGLMEANYMVAGLMFHKILIQEELDIKEVMFILKALRSHSSSPQEPPSSAAASVAETKATAQDSPTTLYPSLENIASSLPPIPSDSSKGANRQNVTGEARGEKDQIHEWVYTSWSAIRSILI